MHIAGDPSYGGLFTFKKLGHCPRVFLFDQAFQQAFHQTSMGPRLGSRGKRTKRADEFPALLASMGPRLGSRGKTRIASMMDSIRMRFNGAATWKSRKARPFGLAAITPCRCFNGAATWKSRKAKGGVRANERPKRFNGAATWKSRKGSELAGIPSTTRRFNGAATWKSRKDTMHVVAGVDLGASMGPRLGSRGKVWDRTGNPAGRVASMGPRLGSRGKAPGSPSPAVPCPCFNGAATWKSRKAPIFLFGQCNLDSFNGAATWKSRKAAFFAVRSFPRVSFNGAATWKSRKVVLACCLWGFHERLQWGRDLEVAESHL